MFSYQRGRSGVRRSAAPKLRAAPAVPDLASTELVAKFFRALGDPTRLDLLEFLVGRDEATGTECGERVDLSQGRVSAHLTCLVACGLVSVRRQGRFAYYRIIDDRVAQLVALGVGMTADHAESIAACLRVGPARR